MIGMAILGAGNRSRALVDLLLRAAAGDVEVISVFDPDKGIAEKAVEGWATPKATIADSASVAISAPDVDWVMVFSLNAFHADQILTAFAAGKHVFTEKPLATTIDDCVRVQHAHASSGLHFATGFVLRYAPLYQAVYELLASGEFGSIVSIAASENIKPAHGGYIMRNWRRFTAQSGPHVLEKCCHDMDILNWLCGDVPRRVSSFGGNSVFTPEHDNLMEKHGRDTYCSWEDPHAVDSPFTSDKDILDTQGCLMEYRNGIQATFQITMSNAISERRLYISCLEGTIIGELYTGHLQYRRLGDQEGTVQSYPGGGHGGGDPSIMKALLQSMQHDEAPLCSGEEGLCSAVVSLALDQAARENRIVSLEPIWQDLGR